MTTAQTVQLLDANNNNISPAVCIDSIYYEGSVDNATYRYALREKFIVGANLDNPIIDRKPDILPSNNESIYVPYIFSEPNNNPTSVWKLSAGAYDIAPDVSLYIISTFKKDYVQKDKANSSSEGYLTVNSSVNNTMYVDINMKDKLVISTTGLNDTYGDRLTFDNSTATLFGTDKVVISSPEVVIHSADISIGDTLSSTTYIYGNYTAIYSLTDLSVGAHRGHLLLDGKLGVIVNSSTDVELHAGANSVIALDASIIKFNEAEFIPPYLSDAQNHRILSVSDGGVPGGTITMSWEEMGEMRLLNYGTVGGTGKFKFVEKDNILSGAQVSFAGGSDYVTIGPDDNLKINIATIGGLTLDASLRQNIEVMTINGKSVVGTTDSMTFVLDSSFNEYKKNLVHFNGDPNGSNMLFINRNNSNEYVITESAEITVSGGSLQAKSFVMSSDRNLKTDIREDCFAKELPAIHGFKWKDTSVQSYGFIAQELEDAGFDHLVINGRNGKGVDYMAALSYKVAQLERENQMLKQSISDLYDKLNNK